MFTGIVEEAGIIQSLKRTDQSIRLAVKSTRTGKRSRPGDSIAVNGCCLTLVRKTSGKGGLVLQFDLLEETWKRTNFAKLAAGSRVNLEGALRADGQFGGHFVSGHIDATGKIRRLDSRGTDHLLEIEAPAGVMRYVVFKGSITVDGISLTVAKVKQRSFQVWIIPHTWEVTNLRDRQVGDLVNLEADLLAKYLDRYLEARSAGKGGGMARTAPG